MTDRGYLLRARLSMGSEREIAQVVVDAAHQICRGDSRQHRRRHQPGVWGSHEEPQSLDPSILRMKVDDY